MERKKTCLSFVLILFSFFTLHSYYEGPISDHFDGNHFYNPWNRREHNFWSFLKWKFISTKTRWPKRKQIIQHDPILQKVEGKELSVTYIGHATFLIQTEGINILTDPVWSDWVGPWPFFWSSIRRVVDPGIAFDALPKIDLVLISHNHYDHLDLPTLKALWKRDHPLILAPLGNDAVIHNADPEIAVKTLDWSECEVVDEKLKVCLEAVQHWSRRGVWDLDKSLWGAFVIKTAAGNIYFAGDTGFAQQIFENVKNKYGTFRLAILPIGSYEPRWFMKYGHLNPEEAVLAHLALGRPYTVASHFKTFPVSNEAYNAPVEDLERAKEKYRTSKFRALEIGETWNVPLEDTKL